MTEPVGHWQRVYAASGQHSWDQDEPVVALDLLQRAGVPPGASVVDVGGGDGPLAGALVRRGHRDVTVLDISERALDGGRRRLGAAADGVRWVVADVRSWHPERTFDVWHDRAVFHFLVAPADRAAYGAALRWGTGAGSVAVVGTFAADGPESCSGLPVARYGPNLLADTLSTVSDVRWLAVTSAREEHRTPFGAVQPFTWVVLRRAGRAGAGDHPAEAGRAGAVRPG